MNRFILRVKLNISIEAGLKLKSFNERSTIVQVL